MITVSDLILGQLFCKRRLFQLKDTGVTDAPLLKRIGQSKLQLFLAPCCACMFVRVFVSVCLYCMSIDHTLKCLAFMVYSP